MRYLTIFLSLICMAFAADAAQDSAKADKRVAFVVGNGNYKNVAALPNPPIDAKAMAAVLRNVFVHGSSVWIALLVIRNPILCNHPSKR